MFTTSITLTETELDFIVRTLDASTESQKFADLMAGLCGELSNLEDQRMAAQERQDYEEWADSNARADMSDDAEVLAMAGMGTDEDYGYFGE